jgi:hypothetical protein
MEGRGISRIKLVFHMAVPAVMRRFCCNLLRITLGASTKAVLPKSMRTSLLAGSGWRAVPTPMF